MHNNFFKFFSFFFFFTKNSNYIYIYIRSRLVFLKTSEVDEAPDVGRSLLERLSMDGDLLVDGVVDVEDAEDPEFSFAKSIADNLPPDGVAGGDDGLAGELAR
jgi:hypothetical protein